VADHQNGTTPGTSASAGDDVVRAADPAEPHTGVSTGKLTAGLAGLVAGALAGAARARIGESNVRRAVIRVVVGGASASPSPGASATCSAPRSASTEVDRLHSQRAHHPAKLGT
jgi:hypothetical protein